jgi:hypothetical protein
MCSAAPSIQPLFYSFSLLFISFTTLTNTKNINDNNHNNQVAFAAATQRNKIEQSSELELEKLTDGIRSQLLKREQELEELRSSKAERVSSRKQTINRLTEACELFNDKYAEMQMQRKNDLERVGGELKRLREMVSSVEIRLLKLSAEDDSDLELTAKEGGQLERNSRAIIERLEFQLRQLRQR